MKLSDWAKKQGMTYKTAWNWFRDGKLPVRAEQMPTGTIIVYEEEHVAEKAVVIYARVSSNDRKEDLAGQVERLKSFASAKGWRVTRTVDEIGSGLNGRRKKLIRLLENPDERMILVEHKDRLSRFGFEFIEAALVSQGRNIIVTDEPEETGDVWQDFVDVVTSMCARIYGRRGAKNRARRALDAAGMNENQG